MTQNLLPTGSVAVVTGGASGIGLASAVRFAAMGMRVCIADLGERRLAAAEAVIASHARDGEAAVLAVDCDVSRAADVARLEDNVRNRFGGTDLLINNAGVQPGSAMFGPAEAWQRVLGVNLWGAIYGTQIFAPRMIARGRPGYIINTGSKQGITTPPGDPAYNVSKAGLKAFTESLAHELRTTQGCHISAHLLIPGFVFTPLAAGGRSEKPDAAWTPEQIVDFMLESLARGDFYILCPDNQVTRAIDERRILWAAGDIVHNRSALSRWDPRYKEDFEAFLKTDQQKSVT